MTSTAAVPIFTGLPTRPAYWWAAIALLGSLAVLGAGAAANLDARSALRAAALLLICCAAVEDVRTRRIRNVLMAPAFVLALASAHALPASLFGALLAPLPFLVIAIPNPGAMGMGDVKLAAVAGALTGFTGLPLWWFGTALAGAVLALIALVQGGPRATLAYGPALVAGLGVVLW